jgi:methionyl-tRNA synthetase
VIVANLKPASLRGVISQGMLLAAEGEGGKLTLAVAENARPGDPVRAEGLDGSPKPQITLKDFEQSPLTMRSGRVFYGEHPLVSPQGPVTAQAPDGASVR